jgi:release factor glutamine methyltransferase
MSVGGYTDPPTLGDQVRRARQRLVAAGIPRREADLDARLLAQEALGWDAVRFFREAGHPAAPSFEGTYATLVARRASREPIAYILGRQEFWNLTFEVTPAVLIPRPETEIIVESVLQQLPDRAQALSIADVCTGSGCLAVVLALAYSRARVSASDVSRAALEVARRNAACHGVASRTFLVESDLLDALRGPFDLIVANPPYVPEREYAALQPEVRDHEPAVALLAGSDGLTVIGRLIDAAAERLAKGGVLIFELGAGQKEAVATLVSASDRLTLHEIRADLQGIPRTAIVQRERV